MRKQCFKLVSINIILPTFSKLNGGRGSVTSCLQKETVRKKYNPNLFPSVV